MEPTFTTRWFYANIAQDQVESGPHTCAVCGLPMSYGVSLKKTLRKTFTDHAALRNVISGVVCAACAWYMSHQELRRSSWYLTAGEARPLAKADLYPLLCQHLEQPPEHDGYYLITTMKRKHLALWAPLSAAGNAILRVRFEVVSLDLDRKWLRLTQAAHRLREHHSWYEIQSDDYNAKFLASWSDPLEFIRLRQGIKPFLHTPYLDLAQYVWSKETT